MYDIYKKWKDSVGCFAAVIAIIAIIVLILGISFLCTSFVYWLFTLVMASFFSIIVPFTWHYALGVWLVVILIRFIFSGTQYATKTR